MSIEWKRVICFLKINSSNNDLILQFASQCILYFKVELWKVIHVKCFNYIEYYEFVSVCIKYFDSNLYVNMIVRHLVVVQGTCMANCVRVMWPEHLFLTFDLRKVSSAVVLLLDWSFGKQCLFVLFSGKNFIKIISSLVRCVFH